MVRLNIPKNEVWLPIKNYEGLYEVSNLGRIRTFYKKSGKTISQIPVIAKTRVDKDGYNRILLYAKNKGFKPINKGVYRIVLETFIGACPLNMEGSHVDSNCKNDQLDNLCWETHLENEHRKERIPLKYHTCFKLTEKEILEIRNFGIIKKLKSRTYIELAELYGVSDETIHTIVVDNTWHGWDYIE